MQSLEIFIVFAISLITVHSKVFYAKTAAHPALAPQPLTYADYDLAGFGYSDDTQQLTTQKCYDAAVSYIGEGKQVVQMSSAQSFKSLEQSLGVSVSVSGGFGMFSASAESTYLRSIQDNDYSLSLNYFQYTSSKVTVEVASDVFTDFGKRAYADGTNPLFGVVCGDQYVATYQQGAMLIMGLNIKLASAADKEEFETEVGVSFGSIISASTKISTAGSEKKISGAVEVHAYQIGGEPTQLSKIFNKDSNGIYYAFSCNIEAMENCLQVASGLLDYATEIFPTQISITENKGLTPLGIPFTTFQPISRLGLKTPDSVVTSEVIKHREDLSNALIEHRYYQDKLYPYVNGAYPVKTDADFNKKIKSLSEKASSNVNLLMQPHGGASDCYSFPENCGKTKSKIDLQLQNITADDIKFLENVKYRIPIEIINAGVLYGTGNGEENSWAVDKAPSPTIVNSAIVTSSKCSFDITQTLDPVFVVKFDGEATTEPLTYIGNSELRLNGGILQQNTSYLQIVEVSPYYFELYHLD